MFSILFVINCGQMSYFCLFLMKNHWKEMVFEGEEREDDEDDDDDDDNVDDTNSLELAKNLITE